MSSPLPIGSVVQIKNKKEKHIIIGKNITKDDNVYSYCCVVYPYGFLIDKQSLYYFNDEEIEEVIFVGNTNY